jgi:hypothetical protein
MLKRGELNVKKDETNDITVIDINHEKYASRAEFI